MNHIINMQFIPTAWKLGVITPISKPGKDSSLVYNSKNQFGFQPNKSTEMAASRFVCDTIQGLNNKLPTIAVLLEFHSEFDTLWHKALIYKMHVMKFDKNVINLVKSYVTGRVFAMKIDIHLSSKREIKADANNVAFC